MTSSTEQERAEFTDGAWYWVEKEGWHDEPPKIAPAMYRADCDAWYSWEFSGISTEYLKVLEPCVHHEQAARRAPAVPQAVPISDELPQGFISDVLTAAGLVRHGKQCKGLADRLGGAVEKIWTTSIAQRKAIAAAPQPPEAALVPSIAVTPEMVEAANEAYCPFGDMELALCAALQVAPIPPGAAPVQLPENLREGEPYDNPAFEALARALGVWGTAQSAVCAQFWIAAKEQST